jgi:hypothetical protein
MKDRDTATVYYNRLTRFTEENKDSQFAARYNNVFKILDMMMDQKEEAPPEVFKILYMQMAVCYYELSDKKNSDICIDTALKY